MLLSVCIPTHDGRGWCLREAIESILPQIAGRHEGKVEIVVGDNGSRDETASMLAGYAEAYPGIFVTHRFSENLGGHNNFLKVVEMARGEYCWLVGSDDRLFPGAIDSVVALLRQNHDIAGITCDWRSFDPAMRVEAKSFSSKCLPPRTHEYFYRDGAVALTELCLLLTFMSAHVFRRSDWQKVVASEGRKAVFAYRHFMHLYIFGSIILRLDGGWIWCASKLVMHRDHNFSLVEELGSGLHQYVLETTEDILKCFAAWVGRDSLAYKAMLKAYFRHWSSRTSIAEWKRLETHTPAVDRLLFAALARSHGSLPEFWLSAAPYLLVPETVYKAPARLKLTSRLLRVTMTLAPRTRIRALLRALKVTNGWTRRYDAHLANVHRLAAEYHRSQGELRYSTGADQRWKPAPTSDLQPMASEPAALAEPASR